jgi:hypothetical protein
VSSALLEEKIMSNIATALQAVNEAVERIKNDATQYFPEAASVGDAVRQGDIYIQKIEDFTEAPQFYKKVESPNPQLAPGDTKGSRHVLDSLDGVEVFEIDGEQASWSGVSALFGHGERERFGWSQFASRVTPILESFGYRGPILRVAKTATVTHPEHGDWVLPSGTYQITFQRTVDQARRVARVLD